MEINLAEIMGKTEGIKPLSENNGIKIVTFEEQRDLAQRDIQENPGLGVIKLNPDGTVAKTPTRYAAVNVESYFINRFKVVKKSIYLVTDYRAIKEQDTGRVYTKRIPAFVISRDGENKLYLEKMVTVSDDEFIADFTGTLDRKSMEQLMPLLEAGMELTKSELPI